MRPSTVVARTEYLQPLAQRTRVVPSHTARRRCSAVVQMELPLLRATTWRDARNPATKRSSDVVRITRHQRAERITWDAATPPNLVAVLMELNLLLDLMEKGVRRKLLPSRLSRKSTKELLCAKIAPAPLTDAVLTVFHQLLARTTTAATCPARIALMAAATTVALQHTVRTERVVVCRHRSSAVQITYCQLAVQTSTAADANTRDSAAVQTTAPPLVDQTTRVVAASTRRTVAVQIASHRPVDQITRVVPVTRISLVAAPMASPSLKDLMDKAAVARTQNSSAARMEERRRRVRTSPDALATPRSTDVARTGPRKLKERTSRAVCRFHLLLGRRAPWRGTEDPAETSPSNGTSTRSTVDARGSGTVAARVTTIDSRPRKSAKKCACSRKAKMPATCQRSPGHARDTSLLGTTTLVESSVDSSSTAAASETPINSRPGKSAKNSASLLMILILASNRKSQVPARATSPNGTSTQNRKPVSSSATAAAKEMITTSRRKSLATNNACNQEGGE